MSRIRRLAAAAPSAGFLSLIALEDRSPGWPESMAGPANTIRARTVNVAARVRNVGTALPSPTGAQMISSREGFGVPSRVLGGSSAYPDLAPEERRFRKVALEGQVTRE
jgi:hypothetical protein